MVIKTDIAIIGAGLVGITAACAFAPLGFDIVVIDATGIDEMRKKGADGRTCAIAAGSKNFFEKIGVWQNMQPYAGEILDIRVTDGDSPVFLHYDHKMVGDEPMGYIVENYYLREALFEKAKQYKNIKIIAPANYTNVDFGDNSCVIEVKTNGEKATTKTINAKLLISADGKKSAIRKLAGIGTHEWLYGQSGIVCTIKHTEHHQNIAQERFLPQGPFAILPMKGGHHSSLVWTEKTELAKLYAAMQIPEIEEQITMRAGEYLGEIKLQGDVQTYPLSLCKAKRYVGKRLALVGDSAHAMHPLAGQGFNVGIRDIEELLGMFEKDNSALSWGSLEQIQEFLKNYEAARMADSIALIAITDILNRCFSNNILPLRAVRRCSMAVVNKASPLKKFFMKHAMGID